MIVLSPHLDDAVWSCHGLLEGATVITVFAGIPGEEVPPHQFDVRSGFASGADAMRVRRQEDFAAAELVGFEPVHLNCLEMGYGGTNPTEAISAELDRHDVDILAGPVGLHHPDHIMVAAIFRQMVAARGFNAWGYEERPYGHLEPDQNAYLPYRGRAMVERAPSPEKRAAVLAYASQIRDDTHLDAILSPELYLNLNGEVAL